MDRDFTFHFGNEPFTIEAGKEKVWPVYLSQHGAKKMLDYLMQNLPQYHNTRVAAPVLSSLSQGPGWTDTPEQSAFLTKLLPDWYAKNVEDSKPARSPESIMVEALQQQVAELSEQMVKIAARPVKVQREKVGGKKKKADDVPSAQDDVSQPDII